LVGIAAAEKILPHFYLMKKTDYLLLHSFFCFTFMYSTDNEGYIKYVLKSHLPKQCWMKVGRVL